jgi:RND family efflux transporter MFP subunit
MRRKFPRLDSATAIVLVVLIVLCVWGAYTLSARQATLGSPAGSEPADDVAQPQVETVQIGRQSLELEFTRRGILEPSGRVSVFPEVTGRVVGRNIDIGDRVQRGDVLLEIDGTLLSIRLEEAQARLKSAQLRLAEAQSQLGDAEESDDEDLQRDVRTRRDAAEAAVKIAETQLAEAEATYASRIVRAPVDGTIAGCFVDEGEFASSTQPVAEIINTDRLVAVVPLTARETASLHDGVQCQVALREPAGYTAAGRLLRVAPVADPRTKRFSAEVEVDNDAERLRSGTPVDVTFRCKTNEPMLLLPRRALTQRDDVLVCFRIQEESDGCVARRVELQWESLPDQPQWLRVLGGLAAGDRVAVGGLIALEDGTRIRPVPLEDRSE